ncbi:MAG TPA: hypothetical protein VFL86_01195 [Burkholderiaceae bacterium]|nr:hypothetical protein [Burkholderiaceae bacterium]
MSTLVVAVLIELLCVVFSPAFAAPPSASTAPSFTEVRRAVHAGSTVTLTPYVADVDPWDGHRFELLSAPQAGSASVTAGGRSLVYAAPATPGVDGFAYRATDRGGLAVEGAATMVVYDDATLSTCRQDSSVTPAGVLDQRTKSNGCAFYGQTTTRVTADGTPVTVDYFVNWPASGAAPKAVVVLIGGGDLNMLIRGNPATGAADVTGGANNFVVRTAQLFADAGYLTVALDRPVPGPTVPPGSTDATTATDLYRVSVDHAVDILAVLKTLNTQNLPVFLAGTSRGALSVVAQNRIATGIASSSSVTIDRADSGRRLYVGRPDTPNLLPQFVRRPTHVLWHANDGCAATPPAGSRALYDSLVAAGVDAAFDTAEGGVRVTAAGNGVSPDICGALNFHGYMGIEHTAVGTLTTWLDRRVAALGGHRMPEAAFAEVATAAGVPRRIPLDALVREPGCQALSYELPGTATSLGGQAVLAGHTVTYTPPPGVSSGTDYFVYVATDGRGGVRAAVVSVRIGG